MTNIIPIEFKISIEHRSFLQIRILQLGLRPLDLDPAVGDPPRHPLLGLHRPLGIKEKKMTKWEPRKLFEKASKVRQCGARSDGELIPIVS
jgi:hypothetical protein